jgi:hypothetical protein
MRVNTASHSLELFHFEDIFFFFGGQSLLQLHMLSCAQRSCSVSPGFVPVPDHLLIVGLSVERLLHLMLVAGDGAENIAKYSLDRGAWAEGLTESSMLLHFENFLG